ncbi:hypothetical protein [Galbibacter sp. BG1]
MTKEERDLKKKIKEWKNEIIEVKLGYWSESKHGWKLLIHYNPETDSGWEGRWFSKRYGIYDKKTKIYKGRRWHILKQMAPSILKEEFDFTFKTQYLEYLKNNK